MGNMSSEQQISYNPVKRQKHQILGPYELVEVQFGNIFQPCVLRKRTHLDIQRINKDVTMMMGRENNVACKHVYKRVFAQLARTENYCSSFKEQEVFYQCFYSDLEEEYLSKKGRNSSFEEGQILNILRDCLLALRLCEELNLKFFHISKKSILKSKSGAYMLIRAEDSQLPHPLQDYVSDFNPQLLVKNHSISPQLLLGVTQIVTNEQSTKDYIFSLGATLLSICLMKQIQFESETIGFVIENEEKKIYFDQKNLQRQVSKLKQLISELKYSDKIKFLLENMIEFDENKRFSIQKLEAAQGQTSRVKVKKIACRKLSFSISKISKENMKTSQTHKTLKIAAPEIESKQRTNIYLDDLPILQRKNVIATDAKNYKNAKMWKYKHENSRTNKQVAYRLINNEELLKDYTPIKHLTSFNVQAGMEGKYVPNVDLPRTQSRYQLVSDQTLKAPISKTSIAFNCTKSKSEMIDNSKTLKYF